MKTKISLRNLYLLGTIAIGLIVLGAGSTFAMFTANANIDNPIYFASNLSSTNLVAETIDIDVPAGEYKYIDFSVSNSSSLLLNYSMWYMPINGLEAGIDSSNDSDKTVGNISSGDNFSLRLAFKNNTDGDITVAIGVSSFTSDVVIPKGSEIIPNVPISLDVSLEDFVYVLGSDNSSISNLSADFYDTSTNSLSKKDVHVSNKIDISEDEVLLIRYTGYGKSVSIPDTFVVDGKNYKPVLLSYVSDGNNLSTGLFYYNHNIKYVKLNNKLRIISLNSTFDGYDDDSMYNMFAGCSSLESISNVPSSINNIESAFYGCSKLNNLDLKSINLKNIDLYSNAFAGVNSSVKVLLGDCEQYSLFISKFGGDYSYITPGDFDCNYQKVEYILSTGAQYINTELYPRDGKYVFEAKIGTTINENDFFEYSIFGNNSLDDSLVGAYGMQYKKDDSSSIVTTCGGSVNDKVSIDEWNDHDVYVIEVNGINSTYTINGRASSCEFISPSYVNETPILLFASGSDDSKYSVMKYYYFKVVDSNGKLVRDMLPCYRKSDGIIGMYDLVNNKFYTNVSTYSASFEKGENIY